MRGTEVRFLAKAADAAILGDDETVVFDVKIDSRQAFEGDMFVCVVGDVNDGHDYIDSAYEQGCRIFLMSDEWKAADFHEKNPDTTIIVCGDTNIAFRDMAKAYLEQFDVHKIAVTGSVGKTTTRNLTAEVLRTKFNTVAAQKNLNTHLGLCMTCFLADENTEAVVFEMGMDRLHEISEYVDWVYPDTCIVTNIGVAHLELLGSRENIALTKLEIAKNLYSGQYLVYNSDSDFMSGEQEIKSIVPGPYKVYGAGCSENASMRIYNVKSNPPEGISFTLACGDGMADFKLPLMGEHNAHNAALACSAGLVYGIDLKTSAEALSKVSGVSKRFEIVKLKDDITLIDDTYNANPVSMKAALKGFSEMPAVRKIAVLADMLQLGENEVSGHNEIGACVAEIGPDVFYAVGTRAKYYLGPASRNADIRIVYGETLQDVEDQIVSELKPGDLILVKGSNVTHIGDFAQRLRRELAKG